MDEGRVRTVVLAAGRSERMGFDKLAAPFAGVPLARRLALALAPLRPLFITTPAVAALLGDLPEVEVLPTEPTAGTSATLWLADAAVLTGLALAVLPADLPFLDAAAVRRFLARVPAEADLAWPVVGETPGHPVVWSPRARAAIPGLRDDEPPARVRGDASLRAVPLPERDDAYVADVDTPEAWTAAERCAVRRGGYAAGMERETNTEKQDDFKNALPSEVTDHPGSGMPRQLRTRGDDQEPLSRAEADVAGISPTPSVVYATDDEDENPEDQRDAHHAEPDEHV